MHSWFWCRCCNGGCLLGALCVPACSCIKSRGAALVHGYSRLRVRFLPPRGSLLLLKRHGVLFDENAHLCLPSPLVCSICDREQGYYADGEDAFDMRLPLAGYKNVRRGKTKAETVPVSAPGDPMPKVTSAEILAAGAANKSQQQQQQEQATAA